MAYGRAVVYFTRAAHAFSAGIKCSHCSLGMGLNSGPNAFQRLLEKKTYAKSPGRLKNTFQCDILCDVSVVVTKLSLNP